MGKKHTIEDCHKLAESRDGKFLSTEYFNTHTKYKWQCEKGHTWKAEYNNILQERWCPKCAKIIRKQTCFEKYGFETPLQNKDLMKISMFNKYGAEHPMFLDDVKNKIKNTNLKKYGSENVFASKEIQERTRQTNLERYGAESPMQNKEIALKVAKSSNNSSILYQWKTKEEIICVGSYEKKTIEYFNDNKIDFDWQIKFDMPDGKKYFVDAYLKESDIYIEIKGYFRKDAEKKWNWFHKEYPNSELWNEKKLREMKIL
jgi:hypothetical protein